MARLARIVVPDFPHHVTQRGVRSMNIFNDDTERRDYLAFMKECGNKFGLKYLSYCLMDNHVHFIVVPRNEHSLSKGIGEGHKLYTRQKNFKDGVRGHLFQSRFFSCPLSESHFYSAIRYVERNPVKAGLVENAWDYEWSSSKYFVGNSKTDPLVNNHSFLGEVMNWREFLSKDDDDSLIISNTKTGRPCGDENFINMIETKLDRDIKKKKPGPKRLIK
ncbi:MAG: transposase [Denitrovibrio sp.]|nr:MAG: transposase [Denitrovibrio sp.]